MQRVTHTRRSYKSAYVSADTSPLTQTSREIIKGGLCALFIEYIYPERSERHRDRAKVASLSPNGTESERCFCSPSRRPSSMRLLLLLFSFLAIEILGRLPRASYSPRLAGVYPAHDPSRESLGTRFRLFWLLSFDPAMSLDPRRRERREREREGKGRRREPQKSFYDFRAGEPLEDARGDLSLFTGFFRFSLSLSLRRILFLKVAIEYTLSIKR